MSYYPVEFLLMIESYFGAAKCITRPTKEQLSISAFPESITPTGPRVLKLAKRANFTR